jgi:hypothetical protein
LKGEIAIIGIFVGPVVFAVTHTLFMPWIDKDFETTEQA